MPKKKVVSVGTKKTAQPTDKSSKKATKKTAKKKTVTTVAKKSKPQKESWPVGSVGSVLMAKDSRLELEKQTPAWLNELREAEKSCFNRLCDERYFAEQVLREKRDELMALPFVNGVHVGYRRKNNETISYPLEICIRIHVDQKYENELDGRITNLLDKTMGGVPVDVFSRSYQVMAATTASSALPPPTQQFNPLRGGIAIVNANVIGNWGTLGLPVFRNGSQVLLTNAHVARSNSPTFPQDILHPPVAGGPVVGELDSDSASVIVRDQFMDAAVITLKNALSTTRLFGPDNGFMNLPIRIGTARTGQDVFIIGAASGLRGGFGRIQSIQGSIDVSGFATTMKGQILATPTSGIPMLTFGDSGSVLLAFADSSEPALDIVGLVHAKGDDGTLVAAAIQKVRERFGFTLF